MVLYTALTYFVILRSSGARLTDKSLVNKAVFSFNSKVKEITSNASS